MENLTDVLLWFSTVSVALMAGVYFTFSAFVMRSLDAIAAPAGMLAMQSINRIIVRSPFLPIFFGSTLACAALVIISSLSLASAGALWTLIGSVVYVVGMFVVTIIGNVPLNNRLEATQADSPEGSEMWSLYLRKWTAWNHVRTITCTAALALMILAISERI